MIPLQMIVWETEAGKQYFHCGLMCSPLDDDPDGTVFLLVNPDDLRIYGQCELCPIALPHLHPALDAFTYDPTHETFTCHKVLGPVPNPRGWWARSMN
jgi:hypothetical protein